MKKFELLAASALAMTAAMPAAAQTGATTSAQNTAPTNGPGQEATSAQSIDPNAASADTGIQDIVVTAQRQSQRLQDVPIAVSAFSADNIEKQQIVNPIALQQSLPSITFTKTGYTTSSFTIRGIGDLCVGVTCDQATAIHVNDMPLATTRLFESEFFDLERVEVLRGPQGTLFGRNATSGVVNFITAKPDLSGVHAAGEFEYGNYDSKRAKAMFNLPITDTLGIRVAGTYLKRDGYTFNTYDNSRIDDRDLYAIRGTLSWEPSSDTRIDLMGYYFREKDNRSRIQKQLCHRDPTGVLGCLPDTKSYETTNGLSTLAAVLTSTEFFNVNNPALGRFALQSLYGADPYAGVVNPADVRTVRLDYRPTYFADEEQYMVKIFHDFGPVNLNITGGYTRNSVDSTVDYNLAVEAPLANNAGLANLNALGRAGSPFAFLNGVRQTLIPNGPAGGVCQSAADPNNVGVYGGNAIGCFPQSLDFDRSRIQNRQFSAEAHIDSKFDGVFNFLLGGIYLDSLSKNNDYFVNAFGLDYASGILGAASSAAIPGVGGNAFLSTPFYRNDSPRFRLKSYGIFGETYFEFSKRAKLTLGLRYNHDDKFVQARNLTLNVLTPYGAQGIQNGFNYAQVDFDPTTPGIQDYARRNVSFGRLTGRAVFDYKIDDNKLLYASYSRGYKSGGINPPVAATFSVPTTFTPEQVDAFEIGSKNTFLNGALRLNVTGFYYKYKGLQLSRIVARTAVNDNVDANIYGLEAEAIVAPIPRFVVNMNASYLHTEITGNKALINPRLPSGGRTDTVIIKDITNASNCVVIPNAGGAAVSNGFVTAVNRAVGLQGPTAISGTGTTGAFGICSVLQAQAAATQTPVTVTDGVPVGLNGNKLPQAPMYKWSVGAQYTMDFGSGWSLVPRADLNYTGNFSASVFNMNVDRVPGYEVVNAQVQLNAPDDRFYLRAFVQNLTNNNAITGQAVADQSSGLYTNIFTIEPRRYGAAVGFKF
ncbi:TonB-dependent receptor [Sphingomonas melonis]|uniref:TonB-dependent receptor n=1 Tax=Sphingomonas melonis TaxID=152682 RepID=UPI001C8C76C9|nr:TonB-dependent receptor [Sphingomonas melonis]MBX8843558.1 TonB-dependent receptor [Sphingomonas melonis]MBX8852998.1 TonB-dependent receptor [Sphingomonas melonis]MBX8898133.1 TonB-dependent receptor [Sphingomonas melonis]